MELIKKIWIIEGTNYIILMKEDLEIVEFIKMQKIELIKKLQIRVK